ncbi:MAG: protein kinase [Myxococcales bacterium]|nr:protein kinase [Myxococcales bacterium]
MGTRAASIVCVGCGERELPPRARFCHICGTPLPEAAAPAGAAVEPVGTADTLVHTPLGKRALLAEAVDVEIPPTIPASQAPTVAASPTAHAPRPREDSPVDDEDDPLVGRTIGNGRFHVTRRLGAGGMGTVYLAEQIAMKRQVVLKFLHQRMSDDAEMTKRFEREALAVSQLSCPNTVIIHDYGQAEDGRFFMAIEYLAGQTLGQLIRRTGALPPLRAIAIILQVLESLAEAHEKGMVHRDLKPDNIMLVERGGSDAMVKVLDFGIVKMLDDGNADAAAAKGDKAKEKLAAIAADGLTREGDVFGSPRYMAPEQILGEAVDLRADIYAIGVILFEMLSGKPPFSADSLLGLFTQQTTGRVPKLDVGEISEPKLEALVQRCLARKRDDRPDDASALAAELRALLPTLIKRQEQTERRLLELAGVKRRYPPLLIVVVALAAAVIGLGVTLLVRGRGGGVEPQALAPGERVFIGAATARIPEWIDQPDKRNGGTLGVVRNIGRRKDALVLASAHAIGRLIDIPARWDPRRQREQYIGDLSKIYERLVMVGASLRPTMRTYWIKLRMSDRAVFDGYALAEPPKSVVALRRAFASMRYRRFNLLLDDAVRAKKCARARRLHRKLGAVIDDFDIKPNRKKTMRFHLDRALGSCAASQKN